MKKIYIFVLVSVLVGVSVLSAFEAEAAHNSRRKPRPRPAVTRQFKPQNTESYKPVVVISKPTATTLSARDITDTGVTLRGTINPNNSNTSVWFYYGTDSTLTHFTSTRLSDIIAKVGDKDLKASLYGLVPGTTYYFRIVGFNSVGMSYGNILSFKTTGTTVSVTKPKVAVSAAEDITTSSATLEGTVNANNSNTSVWFYYGTDSALNYFTSVRLNDLRSTADLTDVTADIHGLVANTTYYFRIFALNSQGSVYSDIKSLKTLTGSIIKPTVAALTPENISGSQATLKGTVNPNNSNTSVWFYYGKDSALKRYTAVRLEDIDSSDLVSNISKVIEGLETGTTYYFQVAALNSAGWNSSNILSFKTTAKAAVGELRGKTLKDLNANSAYDDGELYIRDSSGKACTTAETVQDKVVINYFGPVSGTLLQDQCSLVSGHPIFSKTDLPVGDYVVWLTLPSGWTYVNSLSQQIKIKEGEQSVVFFYIRPAN